MYLKHDGLTVTQWPLLGEEAWGENGVQKLIGSI